MVEIGAFEAKNKLSALLERAEKGEEIVITRRGRPIAMLGPVMRDVARRERAREAARHLRELAKEKGGHFDWEEWKRYRDEGRP